ncbi:MAG: hypothetical protein AB2L24_29340 [Mangrovibacterium sp.]
MYGSKKDKIELLKAIRAGRIKPEEIPESPMIISDIQDVWEGIMVGAAQAEDGEKNNIVFVGEARRVIDELTPEVNRLYQEYKEKDEKTKISPTK